MIQWLKNILGITALESRNALLRALLQEHKRFVREKMAELQDYTRVDADIGFRGNNTIVLTGVYRNQGYVQFYDMGDGEFKILVEQLNDMRTHALIRHLDRPPQFKGVFEL